MSATLALLRPSPYLASRLIARLSLARRANLGRRLRERVEVLAMMNNTPRARAHYLRAVRVLSRFSALTA